MRSPMQGMHVGWVVMGVLWLIVGLWRGVDGHVMEGCTEAALGIVALLIYCDEKDQ